ncbi:hypothetical protein PENSPDRAFT_571905 [Peniophora sp. CONT]|nr:hypothetical protein PENSPDRAFT_571905 [Peniophora sp. CONT]
MPDSGRRHRLPQHRDYVLIPAPLDFTPPDEKSPLPAIIVTPSSPQCSADFSIAFVAPEPKPTVLQRAAAVLSPVHTKLVAPLQTKARLAFVLVLFIFIMAAHLFAHRLATRHPHLQFDSAPASISSADIAALAPFDHSHGIGHGHGHGWFDWRGFWDESEAVEREFVVTEEGENTTSQDEGHASRAAEADIELRRAEAAAR